ncbi:hypothetical protein GGR20_003573 [Devosia subaequoris]|uniref:Condensation domain-containing protein n=1 Tax=Devosia subaequoris TaxID=395930 RepID=A0A7W6IRS8_9HYPH|nr:hypothetical protein [Devosia subaequoris]MBB4053905.1 hypothetical protein [Devosia subaequoris]MCP1211349.1 hypothetical protein [Devosia subaequoris]
MGGIEVKSFSSSSFAGEQVDALALARAAVEKNPQALFTDFQWFLYKGKDTVFFTAFSTRSYDKDALGNMVAEMIALAPQLTHGFVGAKPGQPFPKHLLDAITSVEMVDELDGYPDKWLSKSSDIFEREDLPLFRVMAAVRRDGPDSEGRAAVLQVRSSHALLEGSDSALLTRSASASHGVQSDKSNKLAWGDRLRSALRGGMTTLIYLLLANILAPKEKPWGFRTLAIERHRLRKLANKLGVRQRSLMFALVTHALNGEGAEKHMSKKVIGANYTMLDTKRNSTDDDFFRVRALEAKFKVMDDFVDYVRAVDDTVAGIEQKDITSFQVVIMSMFKAMRAVNRVLPFLPNKRFWRFNGGNDIVLTLVPPHRTYGPLTHGMVEPLYCGAWHSEVNICTFCPGRQYVTLNFSMEQRHVAHVDKIMSLLAEVEQRDVGPHTMAPAVEKLH